jgi:acyl-coenzyme A thioesterase PaaI-like protein
MSTSLSDAPLDRRREVARLLRELVCEVTTVDVDDASFEPIARALSTLRDGLAQQARLRREVQGLHSADHAAKRAGREPIYDRDPLTGLSKALAPPLKRAEHGGETGWEVTFGEAYEGHPGFVHGGDVAAVVDHVLGVTASSAGAAAMTGTLTTRYRRPTPVKTRLTCVGQVTRVEGRKVFCAATLEADGVLVAEAEGIYVRVEPDRY